jgi:gamma-glutamyltranspeptidase/glutathione hydrolase
LFAQTGLGSYQRRLPAIADIEPISDVDASPDFEPIAVTVGKTDLSPSGWKPDDRERVEKLEMRFHPPQARAVDGRSGLISNTGSPIAVHAGIEALKQGGTAADAAATVALTHIAVALGSYVSYAGIMDLVYYEARSGKVYSLNAGWNSYRGETDPSTIPAADLRALGISRQPTSGDEGRKTLVGGFMAGIEAMHKRFGRLPFGQLFQPAIWYAENGVTVTPSMALTIQADGKSLLRTPEGRRFLHQASGESPTTGARIVQAELAQTLRGVATQGARFMYAGPWAEQFVAAVQRDGGKVTMDDMRNYQPTWEEPLSTTFNGATVFVPGRGSAGSYKVLEALNLVEELRLDQKSSYWTDPAVFRTLAQVLQVAEIGPYLAPELAEYERKSGLRFSPADRITKEYARAVAPMIGKLYNHEPAPQTPHHSAGIVVIDRWGNVAALVHTIESMPWGATGIVVGGVPISGVAGIQQHQLAAIKPGDRVSDFAAPTIVMARKKPVLALATVGTSLLPETVRLLLGILGNRLDAQLVVAAPPLLYNPEPPPAGEPFTSQRQLVPEGAYDAEFLKRLDASGVKLLQKPPAQASAIKGTAALATIDIARGIRHSFELPTIIDFADAY